jgi:putative endonuclease
MADHNELGKLGEQKAVDFLHAKGYQIVDRNWYFHHKEVDIIAFDGQVLVIVEVRTRTSSLVVHPRESISPLKVRYLVLAADAYVRYNKIDNRIRFDIVTCLPANGTHWKIEHIEGAFTAQVE